MTSDQELEQEGAELERLLVAYVQKMSERYGVQRAVLHLGINTQFDGKSIHVQWLVNGNSLVGSDIHAVGAYCLQAKANTLTFRRQSEGSCPTLVDGELVWS